MPKSKKLIRKPGYADMKTVNRGNADTRNPHATIEISRTIRVFVSSTFLDMQTERNALNSIVFPYMRKYCGQRGIDFVGVDLRWGITEEESGRGITTHVCLREVDKCRPYFIAMLGERYGWAPRVCQVTPSGKQSFPRGMSITEMEILYGALELPEGATRCFFYLRSPRLSVALSGNVSETKAKKRKIKALKDRIRNSRFPVLDGYDSIDAFSHCVIRDLCTAVDESFPADKCADRFDLERAEHLHFARIRCSTFVGRDRDLALIEQYVANCNPQPPLVISGEPGSGKSSLMAQWYEDHIAACPGHIMFVHFAGAAANSTRWESIAARMITELSRACELGVELPSRVEDLFNLLPSVLATAAAVANHIIILIDGLDRLDTTGDRYGLLWLPASLPPGVCVVLSTTPGDMLELLRQRHSHVHILHPLSRDERVEVIDRYLARYSKRLSKAQCEPILRLRNAGNPLYLSTLLNELRLFGSHEDLPACITYYCRARNIPTLMQKVLLRLEHEYGAHHPKLVRKTLSLLVAARRGLSESEILALLGDLPQSSWAPFHLALEDFTVNQNGVLAISHEHFRIAIRKRYRIGPRNLCRIRLHLADWFSLQASQPRTMEELPWLFEQVGAWERLYNLLRDPNSFLAVWSSNRFEAQSLWVAVERYTAHTPHEGYERAVHCSEDIPKPALLAIAEILMTTSDVDAAASLLDALIQRCDRNKGDISILQLALSRRGNIYHGAGELHLAEALYERILKLCKRAHDRVEIARALGNIGLVRFARGDNKGALLCYHQAEDICRTCGYLDGVQSALGNIGNVHAWSGEDDEALRMYEAQEILCMESGNLGGLITSIGCQGVIYTRRGDFPRAKCLYERQEKLCAEIGDLNGLQISIGNRAATLLEEGLFDEALDCFEKKNTICLKIKNCEGEYRAAVGRAEALARLNRTDAALAVFDETITTLKARKSFADLAKTLLLKAELLRRLQQYQAARDAVFLAHALAQQHGFDAICRTTSALLRND